MINPSPNPNTHLNKKQKFSKILMWLHIPIVPQKLRNQYDRSMATKERVLSEEIGEVERSS